MMGSGSYTPRFPYPFPVCLLQRSPCTKSFLLQFSLLLLLLPVLFALLLPLPLLALTLLVLLLLLLLL